MTSDRSTWSADDLLDEAAAAPLEGWDFSFHDGRVEWDDLPWDFSTRASDLGTTADHMLDMETGGGENLLSRSHAPRLTVATEGWEPALPEAVWNLRPAGVWLVRDEAAPDNVDQDGPDGDHVRGRLPFRDAAFDLVTNRHGSFRASEVARVLRPGGTFLTQQHHSGEADFHLALGIPMPPLRSHEWTLDRCVAQLTEAGLDVVGCDSADRMSRVFDVGAFAWWLRRVPWAVPSFDVDLYRPHLRALHDRIRRDGGVDIRHHVFRVEAVRPARPVDADPTGHDTAEGSATRR